MTSQARKVVVVKAAIVNNGRVLVLDPANLSHGAQRDLPGGHVGPQEDPLLALTREIGEETGLAVRVVGPVRVWAFTTAGGADYVGITFAARANTSDVVLSREHRSHRWLAASEIPDEWGERDELVAAIEIVSRGLPEVCATSSSRL